MMNIDKLKKAIEEGMNSVDYHEADSGGITITLSHSISSENAVTLFIPRDTDMVFWADYEGYEPDSESPVNLFHLPS